MWLPSSTARGSIMGISQTFSDEAHAEVVVQDGVVAKQYITDQAGFQEQAKQWTRKHWSQTPYTLQLCLF